jgi:subtilisin family serine protease
MPTLDPGRDYARVVLVVRKTNCFVEAAQSLQDGQRCSVSLQARVQSQDYPEGFIVDPTFIPVPLGDQELPKLRDKGALQSCLTKLRPSNSNLFAVRGFLPKEGGRVPEQVAGLQVYSDPPVGAMLIPGTHRAVGNIDDVRRKLGVSTFNRNGSPATVGELSQNGLDGSGVGVAVIDSGIFLPHLERPHDEPNLTQLPRDPDLFARCHHKLAARPFLDENNSWLPSPVATPPGRRRIGHGTMCAYDVLAIAPNATLLDYPMLIARFPDDHRVAGTVSAALLAYARLIQIWAIPRTLGHPVPFESLVVTNSWGVFHPCLDDFPPGDPRRFIDNPNHLLRSYITMLAAAGADILFSAGNGGAPHPTPPFLNLTTGTIRGAAAYPEVLTVAGCTVKDVKNKAGTVVAHADERTGYSSQGPSIAGMPPDKPDLTAYTHFLGSQVFGNREADGGTSAACPIAAGCVAALRTKKKPDDMAPSDLFQILKDTARTGHGQTTVDHDYGHGIIDPVKAGRQLGLIPSTTV